MPHYALAVLSGALLAYYGNRLPDPFWSSYLPLLLFFACCASRYRVPCLFLASLLWSSALLHGQLERRLHDDFDNRVVGLSAHVAELPQVNNERVTMLLDEVWIDAYPAPLPTRIRLSWYRQDQVPLAGERWYFDARLRQPRGRLNSAGFDVEAWQFAQGIGAHGYVVESRNNRRLQAAPIGSVDVLRTRLAAAIDAACHECRHAGLLKALALGYRGDIEATARDILQFTGTAHLLAISGLHVGLVALLFYLLGLCSWRLGGYRLGINRREFAMLASLAAAAAYAALAGFSLPTQRALIMLAVVFLGQCLHYRVNLLHSLSLALIVILVVDPAAVGSASLWLSFGALLVICFVQFRMPGKRNGWRQLLYLQGYFVVLFAIPGILIFGQLNLASLPANLVAIPALSLLILPLVLTASALSAIAPSLAGHVFAIADWLLQRLLDYLDWLLSMGLQARHLEHYPVPLLLLAFGLLLLCLMPRLPAARGAALAGLLVCLGWQPQRLSPGEFELRVLDVGMGSALLLRTRHHSLVYDFGPGRANGFNAAEQALLPVMHRLGLRNTDLAIVSHVDQDHSGGLHGFAGRYAPAQLVSGTPRALRRRFALPHRVASCHGLPGWRWDGVAFRVLDSGRRRAGTNNRSCILLVAGYHRVLIPGDIEAVVESQLVKRHGDGLAADVLLAPHHGSKTSSSQPFLDRVSPRAAIFTVGRNNRWRFPHAVVEARYRALGASLYRSDRDGEIRVHSSASGLRIDALRDPPKRLWRRW